jgi:hypothetical protein
MPVAARDVGERRGSSSRRKSAPSPDNNGHENKANFVVLARRREILYDDSPEEKQAPEDAPYALRAYRTTWQHTDAA